MKQIIIIAIIVIVIYNLFFKKKQKQDDQSSQHPATTRPKAASPAKKTSAGGTPPQVGDDIDYDAFSRAFAAMNDESAPQTSSSTSKKSPPAPTPKAAKKFAEKTDDSSSGSSSTPQVGDEIDTDAFARAFAAMTGETPADSSESTKDSGFKGGSDAKAPSSEADTSALTKVIQDYYVSMWNSKNGTLYTELDVTMSIDHFAIQIKGDHVVDSVWLRGDDVPLVSETKYASMPGATESLTCPESAASAVFRRVKETLEGLGTIQYQDELFYPIGKKQSAPTGSGSSSDPTAPDAATMAQLQAMLEQQMRDNKD